MREIGELTGDVGRRETRGVRRAVSPAELKEVIRVGQ
jgi:hypothetical protein